MIKTVSPFQAIDGADYPIDEGVFSTTADVVYFPVRHHSPAATRCLVDLMRDLRPRHVLIEGPSDFNDRLGELALSHDLPIAIYSYFEMTARPVDDDAVDARPETVRAGAFYPFCVYSPEWQAIVAAREIGARCRFIDLPWADVARHDRTANRYADAEMRRSSYVESVCRELGVDGFDGVWDTMFEIDPALGVDEYLRRCHTLCYHMRLADGYASEVDLAREREMARHIDEVKADGPVLVVTGGYHSFALYARVNGRDFSGNRERPEMGKGTDDIDEKVDSGDASPSRIGVSIRSRGIALTPYSYARLDSLTGYDSGMPNPGFYHQAWLSRQEKHAPKVTTSTTFGSSPHPPVSGGATLSGVGVGSEVFGYDVYRNLLAQAVDALRKRGQTASTADVIAVDTVAGGLASLRGHAWVWRADLVDGVIGALIKDELSIGGSHPLLDAVNDVFRGSLRGRLAEGAQLPPLVHDITRHLRDNDLTPDAAPRHVTLELGPRTEGLARSRVLHAMRVLGIPGFRKTAGVDFTQRDELLRFWEEWSIVWAPEFDAACIEASVFGGSLADAVLAKLRERAASSTRDAESAALILLDACLVGADLTTEFARDLTADIRTDARFFSVTSALGHLLYLFRYDEALGVSGDPAIGELLRETFDRSLWLLETIGRPVDMDKEIMEGVRTLIEAFERSRSLLSARGDELLSILDRIGCDPAQTPVLRGSARGAQWILGVLAPEILLSDMIACGEPARLGDFLTGLFHLAREAAQRRPELLTAVDELVVTYTDDEYLEALPSLRLAFSYFTPREKNHMARTLLRALGLDDTAPLPDLTVTAEVAVAAMAFEGRLFETLKKYGIRDGGPGE